MYGKSVKCDVCDRQDFIPEFFAERDTFFDAGFEGWIRVTVNRPRDYGWSFRDAKYASTVGSADCCSLDCAQTYLRTARETIPVDAVSS